MAEKEGISIQVCQIALHLLSVETYEWFHIKMWIKEQLPRLTNELMEYSKQAFSAQTQILSKKEALQFLYDFNADMRITFEAFKKKREKQVRNDCSHFLNFQSIFLPIFLKYFYLKFVIAVNKFLIQLFCL